ncbi:response regulator transcription factor [Alkalibacter mobilis]|uniref:response regulator transcription factor n=1 Tax=Alkalibacter mobilis TaxID=2787712 RepID=UPI00189E63D4|nr:response regulator transcription factor [Alkalibacter mobilis]MBF7095877.1 response regulator transcription factor [Alkalibacter mobilis]
MSCKIAVVEDEKNIFELIKFNLEKNGYVVSGTNDGADAIDLVKTTNPALVILDLMLPNKDGLNILKEMRETEGISKTPVIVLTARDTEFDKVLGFEIGADDYLTKPFSIKELVARVKAVLRRSLEVVHDEDIIKIDNIEMHQEAFKVFKSGELVNLTLKEYELLALLIKNRGKVLNRNYLLDTVWGYDYIGETRTVDVHIRHLRQKIEDDDNNPKFIETVRGVGYRFKE